MVWSEFFHMGGYAFYVWTSWGLTFLIVFILWLQAKLAKKKIIVEINRQIRHESKLNTG